MSKSVAAAKWGTTVVLLLVAVVALFPPLVCPEGNVMPGDFSFTGSRGFLLDPTPMVYYKLMADGGMAGNGTIVDTGRLLSEVVFLVAIGLLLQTCGRCTRRQDG